MNWGVENNFVLQARGKEKGRWREDEWMEKDRQVDGRREESPRLTDRREESTVQYSR